VQPWRGTRYRDEFPEPYPQEPQEPQEPQDQWGDEDPDWSPGYGTRQYRRRRCACCGR
jgi:hypothetical protein